MFFLSIFLPFFSYLFSIIFKNYLSNKQISFISCGFLLSATILSAISFYLINSSEESIVLISNWITSGSFSVDWSIKLNLLSGSMILMVNLVSTLIHIYSVGYMEKDPKISIFMGYLGLFTFFMLLLVSSNNLLQLFLGWEGVGLTSYLLIGFWNYKDSANKAAIKAFVINRVGDFGLLLAIFTIFVVFGTLNINEIMILVNSYSDTFFDFLGIKIHSITLISILLFIGCMGKSAQFGLHTWLPDAMEGPTPVSALIHAATMVTAGVFLLILMSPLIEVSIFASNTILVVGSLTCIFAASVAIFQNDIKKIIAYSTCSQLGYMFMAIGASAYSLAYFHLISHAFFKALLFLGAGSVIHSMSDEQNIKNMGGLYNKIPLTYLTMIIGSLSLIGIPFFSGYFSKDLILETLFLRDSFFASYAFFIGLTAVLFTTLYSLRLIIYVFHRKSMADEKVIAHIHESPFIMTFPLIILSIFAIFFGMFFYSYFIGTEYLNVWSEIIFVDKSLNENFIYENMPIFYKKLPLIVILIGLTMSYFTYFSLDNFIPIIKKRFKIIHNFFKNKWYIDEIYQNTIVSVVFYLGKGFWKSVDRDLIDNLGPNGMSKFVGSISLIVSKMQSGFLYHYVLSIIIGLTLLISLYTYIF
ncbi:MAG: NADH-quinone oxidoreductase subunit L [Alphaproteobacteria bacterium]